MELELADEDEAVLYKIADTFVSLPHPDAMERLEGEKDEADKQIEELQGKLDGFEDEMKGLKVQLYAKFGDNISKSRARRGGWVWVYADLSFDVVSVREQISNVTEQPQRSQSAIFCTCIFQPPQSMSASSVTHTFD